MMYAYCRVSTERQSLKRQTENISKAFPEIPGSAYFCDKFTGSTQDRPSWQKLLRKVKTGDTIVFDSVSRMSRDAEAGAAQYEELYARGVNLVFLNEPHINTAIFKTTAENRIRIATETGKVSTNKLLCNLETMLNEFMLDLAKEQIRIAFDQAEKERLDICKRVKDGMRAAQIAAAEQGEVKTYGARPGVKLTTKKSVAAKETIRQHSKDFDGSLNDIECMKLAGCSRNSYYKYKAELRAEQA